MTLECKHLLSLPTLTNFPLGSCGDMPMLLGKYLEENACGNFDYMLGYRNGKSHAWIQQEDLIVDITADQFEDCQEPIIVTINSKWHQQFNGKNQNKADIEIYDFNTKRNLQINYDLIMRYIQCE